MIGYDERSMSLREKEKRKQYQGDFKSYFVERGEEDENGKEVTARFEKQKSEDR